MPTETRLTRSVSVALTVVAALVLAGCTATTSPEATGEPSASVEPTPTAAPALIPIAGGDCEAFLSEDEFVTLLGLDASAPRSESAPSYPGGPAARVGGLDCSWTPGLADGLGWTAQLVLSAAPAAVGTAEQLADTEGLSPMCQSDAGCASGVVGDWWYLARLDDLTPDASLTADARAAVVDAIESRLAALGAAPALPEQPDPVDCAALSTALDVEGLALAEGVPTTDALATPSGSVVDEAALAAFHGVGCSFAPLVEDGSGSVWLSVLLWPGDAAFLAGRGGSGAAPLALSAATSAVAWSEGGAETVWASDGAASLRLQQGDGLTPDAGTLAERIAGPALAQLAG